jgi:ribose 5-phosphate isomerase RpiB
MPSRCVWCCVKVACGFDHAGVALHDVVISELVDGGHEVLDLGAADDYPLIALAVARAICDGQAERGILVWLGHRGIGRSDEGPRDPCSNGQ